MNQTNCREMFNNAVEHFFEILPVSDLNDIADAADAVLLARDELSGLNEFELDGVIADVAVVSEALGECGITLSSAPNLTLTGRKTYKILNKPMRFDA